MSTLSPQGKVSIQPSSRASSAPALVSPLSRMDFFHRSGRYLSSEACEHLLLQHLCNLSPQGNVSIRRSVLVSSAPAFVYPPSRRDACCTMTRGPLLYRRVRYPSSGVCELFPLERLPSHLPETVHLLPFNGVCELILLQRVSTRCSGWTSSTAGQGIHPAELASFFCRAEQKNLASSAGWQPFPAVKKLRPGQLVDKSCSRRCLR